MGTLSTGLRAAWPDHEDIRVRLAAGIGLEPEERAERVDAAMSLRE